MDIIDILTLAINLILKGDSSVLTIVGLSLTISISAVLLATVIGLPIGALVALTRFPGRAGVVLLLNAAMGLPPVVVGLAIYLLLSRAGPLGEFGLLFTPTAMVFAQAVLVLPIIAALGRQTVADLWVEYGDLLHSFGSGPFTSAPTLLWDARYSLATATLAGFGRAIAEVGAVMIVGGNIAGVTRTMTTTIALETSKGNLALAMALGAILMGLSILVNGGVQLISGIAGRKQA
jgi:tungstate transport system permease protein